ncbi:MAG: prolipoprotein diacylglyceryl transferase [Saprospiraceae bacterium]|nr:prolipoprotein diacylglyceryl transferase [Saprospiraceae bacterium]
MYPDLSYVFHDLFGTPADNWASIVKIFGLMLAIAILCSSYFLGLEIRRREQNGSLKQLKVTKNGKTTLIWPHEKVGDITIVAAISGVIGAKVFALFESVESIKVFIQDPIHSLISGSGLAIYGGLIVAFFAVTRYVKKLGINVLDMCDATAPSLMIGYGVGRIGCQLSGDGDWGIVAGPKPDWFVLPDWLWSSTYPRNVANEGVKMAQCAGKYCMELTQGVFPTPIFETILAFIIFGILWSLRKKLIRPGQIFFLYCALNGLERFFIEKIRVNDTFDLGAFKASQATIIAFFLFLIGIAGLIFVTKKGQSVPKMP